MARRVVDALNPVRQTKGTMLSDTWIGEGPDSFPETVWFSVLSAAGPSSARRAALNSLCSKYWRPVYAFIRASRGCTIEDAKDLCQDFFRHILEYDMLRRYEPSRGRFRQYLKGALRRFLAETHRTSRSLKRGGGRPVISLDQESPEAGNLPAPDAGTSPEETFDRQWASTVLTRSVRRLLKTLKDEGRRIQLEVYKRYELAAGDRPTYEKVAAELDIPPHQVKNSLDAARRRLQQIIAEEIRDSVTSQEELEQELDDLFSE